MNGSRHARKVPVSRPHLKCWDDEACRYLHQCHKPSGLICDTAGCEEPAGTWWTPIWCPDHDVERLTQISGEFDRILHSLRGTLMGH